MAKEEYKTRAEEREAEREQRRNEAKEQESKVQNTVDKASLFETTMLLFIYFQLKKNLEKAQEKKAIRLKEKEKLTQQEKKQILNEMKSSKAESVNSLRKELKKQTTTLKKELKKSVNSDLKDVGNLAYENLDNRSKGKVKPSETVTKRTKEANRYLTKCITSKSSSYTIGNMSLERYLNNTQDETMEEFLNGETTIDEAMIRITDDLSDKGINVVNYKSGINRSVETLVRQQMLYIAKETAQDIREENAKADNVTIWEFDAHANARPSHQVWQGKRYDTTGKEYPTLNELTHGEHNDYNCKHRAFPVYNKADPYAVSKERLTNINTEPFEFNGKTFDGYQATQEMRRLERNIRKYKKQIVILEADNKDSTQAKYLQKKWSKEYTEFCKAFGTYRRADRLRVAK